MKLLQILKILQNKVDNEPFNIKLLFNTSFYNQEFIEMLDSFKTYNHIGITHTMLNNYNWELIPNGFIVLVCDNVKLIYRKGQMCTGIVAYSNIYTPLRRFSNELLNEISENKELNWNSTEKQIFLINFDSTKWNRDQEKLRQEQEMSITIGHNV